MAVSLAIRIARAAAAVLVVATWLSTPARADNAAASSVTMPSCSWDRPGHDPFTGDVVNAVDRYRDIPADVRARLKARMAKRDYDDVVSIRRDSITGKSRYGSTIHDMHFGTRRVCHSVTRDSWTPSMEERGLVYCDGGQCILVPTVCRNVSRITRAEVSPAHADGEMPDDAALPVLALDNEPSFVAPDDMKRPLRSGGPVGTDVGTPYLLPAQPDGAGSPSEAAAQASGSDERPAPLPPAGPFLTGGLGIPPPGIPGSGSVPPISGVTIADQPPPTATTPVPEPETLALMLSGLAAIALSRRRAQARRRAGANQGPTVSE